MVWTRIFENRIFLFKEKIKQNAFFWLRTIFQHCMFVESEMCIQFKRRFFRTIFFDNFVKVGKRCFFRIFGRKRQKTVASSKNRNFARMEVPGIWYCNIVLYRVLNFPLTYVVCPHCGVFTVRVKSRDHIDQATLSGARHFCCKFSVNFPL